MQIKKLGNYEIIEKVGEGGMGQVFRGRDTRLDRTVAVKILPKQLSESRGFKVRFEREARVISSLSHPNICTLYDVGNENGMDYLVMEFLEGETLADRISKGPLLPGEALQTAVQVADALDTAHRQGIIHRDLKPGNVMLTATGAKLLDFGLAKSSVGEGETDLTTSPTVTTPLTAEGSIVGTYQYMAPEQLEGEEVDARSDIFAFGAMLHEMTTGLKAFEGKTHASLIASILKEEPRPISSITTATPPALDHVVKKCLEKDREKRWQTARDLLHELQWIAEGGSLPGAPAYDAGRSDKGRARLAWSVAAASVVVALASIAFALGLFGGGREPETDVLRFTVSPPEELTAVGTPKISPDGRLLAFNGVDESGNQLLWVRPLSELQAHALQGTGGAGRPFWSPDSRYLGFFAAGKLKKVSVAGGPAQTICDSGTGADGSWGAEDIIVFDGNSSDSLRKVSAAGGVPGPATTFDRSKEDRYHAWPHFLPDGRNFLYLASTPEGDEIRVGSLEGAKDRVLWTADGYAEYCGTGHLLFVRDQTLLAQRFDARALEPLGEPFPVVDGVGTLASGGASFSVSRNGVLAYIAGAVGSRRLVWVDRTGQELSQVGTAADYFEPWLSPDGARVAVDIDNPRDRTGDIWILDIERDIITRFTFDAGDDRTPIWSQDGSRILFVSNRGNAPGIYEKPSSGAGGATRVKELTVPSGLSGFTPDGRYLLFAENVPGQSWNIMAMSTSGDGEIIPVLTTGFVETQGAISPDGRYLAYASSESGRLEIYVREFPGPGGKWQVSNAGGSEPFWRGDGKELFYLTPGRSLTAVGISTENGFRPGRPEGLFVAPVSTDIITRNRYYPDPSGERFLLLVTAEELAVTTIVVNWTADFAER